MRRQEASLSRVMVTTLFEVLIGSSILLVLIADPSKAARFQGTEAIARLEVENGKIAYVRNGDIYAMNADGSGAQRLTHTPSGESYPTWSPDGKRIAFTRHLEDYGFDEEYDIYVMRADGSNIKRLTNAPMWDRMPTWSPDGKRIAFTSARDCNGNDGSDLEPWCYSEIYVMDADGTNETRLTHTVDNEEAPAWSPDGTKLVFSWSSDWDEPYQGIFEMRPLPAGSDNQPRYLTSGRNPAWSPDGTKLAFDRRGEESYDIYVLDAAPEGPDNQPINLTTGSAAHDQEPTWSPDGTQILYTSESPDLRDTLHVMDAADGAPLGNVTPKGGFEAWWGVSWRSQPYAAPKVTRVVPADTSKGVERTDNVRSYFSEAMKSTTINETTFKLYRSGSKTPVRANVRYDAVTRRATLDPEHRLAPGTTYKAVITSGAEDLAGNHLAEREVWRFTTMA